MTVNGDNYSFIDENGNVGGQAIIHMRSKPPNEDGTIGFMAEPGTVEWLAWEAYFEQTKVDDFGIVQKVFPKQLANMRSRASARKPYMVPDRLPWLFDPTFTPDRVKPKPPVKQSRDMTNDERAEMVQRTLKRVNSPEFTRKIAKRTWVDAMYRLCPDRAAFTAILKERPDLVERATEVEMGHPMDPKASYGLGWGAIRAEVEAIYRQQFLSNRKEAAE